MKKFKVQYGYRVVGWCEVEAKTKKEALGKFLDADDFGCDEEVGFIRGLTAKKI